MNTALHLGPLTLPYPLLLLIAAVVLGGWLADRSARRRDAAPPPVGRLLLAAAVVSRLAFVARFPEYYLDAPWSLLDIRDGGWSPSAAIATLLLASLWTAWRHPAWRTPLASGLLPGLLLWLGGTALLDRLPQAAAHTLPDWQLTTVDGDLLPLADARGHPVVLNLWATWCPPCRREMPALQQAREDHPDVRIVLLNQGESGSVVARYLAEAGLSSDDVALDPAGLAGRHFGLAVLPSTLFFDAEGKLVDVRLGELSRATLAQRLRRLAAQPMATGAPPPALPGRP